MNQTLFSRCGVKEIQGDGTVVFDHSVRVVDRDSEVVLPKGIDYERFSLNPVFLWSHRKEIPAIGTVITDLISVSEKAFSAPVKFDENDPFAVMIYNKYENHILNAVSIGFRVIKLGPPVLEGQRGGTIEKSELIESSAVCVPSNWAALRKEVEIARRVGEDDHAFAYYQQILKIASEFDDDNFRQKVWQIPEIGPPAMEEVKAPEKEIPLRALVGDLKGSYQWINNNLEYGLESYAKQYVEYGEDGWFFDLVATYETEAIFCLAKFATAPEYWPCYKAAWSTAEGIPAWDMTKEPTPVEVKVEILEKIADRTLRVPVPAPEGYTPDAARGERMTNYLKAMPLQHRLVCQDHEIAGFEHHDVIKGNLVTVWKDVARSMVALLKDESITIEEKRPIYIHLAEHYAEFNQQPPSFSDYTGEEPQEEKEPQPKDLSVYLGDPMFVSELKKQLVTDLLGGNNNA